MFRWPLLVLLVLWLPAEEPSGNTQSGIVTPTTDAPSTAPVAAPEIGFRDLEWWVSDHHGIHGWYGGQDLTSIPSVMGRIQALRITGIQEMVWDHAFYRVQGVMRQDDRTWFLGFEKGTLKLRHLEHRRWQVEFTPMSGDSPTRIFRTHRPEFGSIDPP